MGTTERLVLDLPDLAADIEEIRRRVAEALAEADADEVISADGVFAELRAKINAIAARRG
jgi:hypothetical protein